MYKVEQLFYYIENNLEDYEIIELNNELALRNCDEQAFIFETEEYFEDWAQEYVAREGALSLLYKIYFGDFNPNDEFYRFNGYENLISINKYDVRDVALEFLQDLMYGEEEFVMQQLEYMNREEEEIKEYISNLNL